MWAWPSADIVLIKSDLRDVPAALQLSKAVLRNIKQNLFWAFAYNAVCIPVAAGVLYPLLHLQLSPMLAAAAMSLSSVTVVSNALRLRLFKPCLPDQSVSEPAPERAVLIQKSEGKTMKKTIQIEGMMCNHCTAHVEKALSALDGVSTAKADLENKCAVVELTRDVANDVLKSAVVEAGYEVTGIS